ncbi:hypothetical protein LQV63_02585 [Paenibacillus profundus]|uniref:Uncharacterized protein n=1 Tax=Paenibacillus profundus TaxID=1173085 RepID=A0ABS8YAK8_9BACL|nr:MULTISPECIES: hypothetical protein [Paenibacillus]MCE5168209.1 hypothetical protein [Paenibacillus profundus]
MNVQWLKVFAAAIHRHGAQRGYRPEASILSNYMNMMKSKRSATLIVRGAFLCCMTIR